MTWGGDDGQLASSDSEALRLGGLCWQVSIHVYVVFVDCGAGAGTFKESVLKGVHLEWALGGAPGHF